MEAIIYIPGLGTRLYDQSIESFAYRFKKSLDINDENIKQHYDIEFRKIHYGRDNKLESNIASICITENGEKKIEYDIYELDYGKTLTDKFEKKNIVIRVLLLFFSIVIKIPEIIFMFVKSIFSGSQMRITLSFKAILQFSFAATVLLLLSILGLILILSLISYLPTFLQINNLPSIYSNPVIKFLDDLKNHTGAKYVIGISTLLFLLMPNVKNFISVIATEYLCTMYYLNFGQSRQNIIGKLEELTEYVAECKVYSSISFYCYSFGSIIAADALFPVEGKPSFRFTNSITGRIISRTEKNLILN